MLGGNMKIVLIGNTDFCIYNYRFELIKKLVELGHEVFVFSPLGKYVSSLVENGCVHKQIEIEQHGTNPFADLRLLKKLKNELRLINPDYVFGYTIKPNIYGALACKKLKINFIANITGLGPSVENKGIIQLIAVSLYRFSFSSIQTVFFQNSENKAFFEKKKIALGKHKLLPGSGVNLQRFAYTPLHDGAVTRFVFISRIRQEKGIDEFIGAARFFQNNSSIEFHVCGPCDDGYKWICSEESIIYHGMIDHVENVLKDMDCLVFPTYYAEGLANVLLEACAMGRPIITTDRAGCREVIDEGYNGFIVRPKDSEDLIGKISSFLNMSKSDREQMGKNGRIKMEKEFDRNIIIKRYLSEIGEVGD